MSPASIGRLGDHQPTPVRLLPGSGDPVHAWAALQEDDNTDIEQKNWTYVHKLLGYLRCDSPAAQAAIDALYRHVLRLSLLLPSSVKLLAMPTGPSRGAGG